MALSRTVDPTVDAVTLTDLKRHLRVTHNDEDFYLENFLLTGATRLTEQITQRALINQTWTLTLDGFGTDKIVIPKPPLSSVSSITYIDEDGNSQTWSSSNYTVVTPSGEFAPHGHVEPAYSEVYPTTRNVPESVTITFVAGYGAAESNVPPGLRLGLMMIAEDLYGQRGSQIIGVPMFPAVWTSEQMLGPWVAWREDLRYQ